MATFEETLDKAIEVAVKRAILKAHPVGSLYLSLTDENPSISLGGVHGSRLAQGNVCGERTVAMQWEQKLVQGYRTSRGRLRQMTIAITGVQAQRRQERLPMRITVVRTSAITTGQELVATALRSTPRAHRQFMANRQRFSLPPWRSTFGGGQRNGYV